MICSILIVDDSPILRSAMAKVARLAGITNECIFEAGNGREALDVLERVSIDLVLLDLNMPIMDGEAFAIEVQRHPAHSKTKIAVVSSEANQARLERMQSLGAVHTLTKPFEPEDLCMVITSLLGARQCAN